MKGKSFMCSYWSMKMKLLNLPLIRVLECIRLALQPCPKHSRSERKWQWYYEMRFCNFDRFKVLLATDELHKWSERAEK